MTAIVWLRRDLRVRDHPALRAALAEAKRVVPLFCFDDSLLHGRHASGPRTEFLLECLAGLDRSLRERGSRLVVRRGRPERELPALAAEVGAGAVHVSDDAGPYARRQDERVGRTLAAAGIRLVRHPGVGAVDDVAELCTGAGKPYIAHRCGLRGRMVKGGVIRAGDPIGSAAVEPTRPALRRSPAVPGAGSAALVYPGARNRQPLLVRRGRKSSVIGHQLVGLDS